MLLLPQQCCAGTFRVQNRSHFVNSSTHSQFKGLDTWLEQHRAELHDVLVEPGAFILFGECVPFLCSICTFEQCFPPVRWMYAKHSIHYTALPSLFLAFDIYDIRNNVFLSRALRDERLSTTSIRAVPLIAEVRLHLT
jgi:atypical dual specificity phosphatase